ncbi:MAG: bifunctional hydroxymethylpyrimidine kinase/phosphomethylpyrimidine kinase [Deinococcales bacterium]
MSQGFSETEVKVLSIGGSDPFGAAGIQADIKTFSALEAYGMSVLTTVTAQNSLGVYGRYDVPVDFIELQLESILGDGGINALKTGFLGRHEVIESIAEVISLLNIPKIIDPVLVNGKGEQIISNLALKAYRERLFPLASLFSPNLREAGLLLGRRLSNLTQVEQAAHELLNEGPQAVLIKGGYLESAKGADFLLYQGKASLEGQWFFGKAIDTPNTHGSGDTLSAAISVFLARGFVLKDAVKEAKDYLQKALEAGALRQIGSGRGPLKHHV